jgi:hypothetical protein
MVGPGSNPGDRHSGRDRRDGRRVLDLPGRADAPVVRLTPPVVIAVLLIMIGWWLDSRMIRAGKAFLFIAGLIGVLLAAGLIPDINGYAVGTVMLAIEAALVASGAAYRRPRMEVEAITPVDGL